MPSLPVANLIITANDCITFSSGSPVPNSGVSSKHSIIDCQLLQHTIKVKINYCVNNPLSKAQFITAPF